MSTTSIPTAANNNNGIIIAAIIEPLAASSVLFPKIKVEKQEVTNLAICNKS